jgi:hypothetical protein
MPCIIITSKPLRVYKREHFGYPGKNPGQRHFQYYNEMPTTVKSKNAVTFNNSTYMVLNRVTSPMIFGSGENRAELLSCCH